MEPTSKAVKIHVPHDFEVPLFYTTASLTHRGLALRLGAEAVSILQKKALDTVRQETHAEAVKQATQEFESMLETQEKETATLTAKLKAQIAKADEAYRAAQMRIDALEAEASRTRTIAHKEARESFAEILAVKDAQIQQLQSTLEKQLDTVTSKVEGLQSSMTKTFASSKDKGNYGEALVEGWLKRAFDCDVYQVAKDRETADIRLTRPGVGGAAGSSYFWEIKNYTRMVTTEEVIKFRRDLALHPDVRGGVMVSLRQGIVGRSRGGDIDVEFLEDGRFILYLSNFMAREDPVFYLQTLRPFFDTVEAMTKPVKEEAEAVRILEAKAALITNLLRSHSAGVTKHKNSLVGHRKRMDSMFAEFQAYILEAEAQLATLLRIAVGGDAATTSVQAEVNTLLSPFVFRKESLADCVDDKVRDFVKWLLGATESREGTQVEIKDLLERAKAAGFTEKFVRGLREELFQETAWAKGARHVLGLRWIPSPPEGSATGGN
jgi:hypothetical protein